MNSVRYECDVVVIGAGFAGLSAATALAERGARVVVLEARRQLGGRATAYRDPITGERIDNGQHVLAGCYDETLTFLRRIDGEHLLRRPSTLAVPMIDEVGTRMELRLPPLPSPFHLLAGVLAWRELTWAERRAILRVGPLLRRLASRARAGSASAAIDRARPLGDETVREWLHRHGQPARLCGLFWEPLALATLNQSIDRASVGPFLAVMARMLAGGVDAASLLLPATLLDELYAEPSRRYLHARNGTVLVGSPARITFENERVSSVEAGDRSYRAPIVIAAVPWFAFSGLFREPPPALDATIDRAVRLASSPIVTVNVWLDRPALDDDFIGLPGRTFQWVFDKSRIVGSSLTHLSLVSSGADDVVALDNLEVSQRALLELRAALPTVRDRTVRRVSVVRERRATFSLMPGMPLRPGTKTAIAGLLLAGDWIDTGLPATIESAVVSGHRAAALAAEQIH